MTRSHKTATQKREAHIAEHRNRRTFSIVRGLTLWGVLTGTFIFLIAENAYPFDPNVNSAAYEMLNDLYVIMFLAGVYGLAEGMQTYFFYMYPLDNQKEVYASDVKGRMRRSQLKKRAQKSR